jgi:predicted dehydrogenase
MSAVPPLAVPTAPLRWGLIGAARIAASALLPAFRAAPGQEVVAVAARDPGRARAFAEMHGVPRWHASYDALLADPAIDAVYIAVTNDRHVPLAEAALAAGKHVLCEKPLALAAAEVERLAAVEAAAGRRVMEAFCYGFQPHVGRLLDLIAGGRLGRLVAADMVFAGPLGDTADFRHVKALGGGALLDLGTYCVDLLRRLVGRDPQAVAAHATLAGEVDETFHGLLDFGDLAASFAVSFAAPRHQRLTLVGTDAVATVDWPIIGRGRRATLTLDGVADLFPETDAYLGMVRHFHAALAGAPLRHGLADALRQARILDALAAAAATGSVVAVGGPRSAGSP